MLPYIEIAGHQVAMYAVCIMAGLIFGIGAAVFRAKIYDCEREDVLFASFYGVLGLAAGGKILYLLTLLPFLIKNAALVFTHKENLQALLAGGFVFYGGLLGALGGMLIYVKQYQLKWMELLETIVLSVPLVHCFGRIGCFCAGCCYGREVPKPWGVVFSHSVAAPAGAALFPVQLVEAAGNLVLFAVLLCVFWNKKTEGQITGSYLVAYSVMRFFLEYLRADASRGIWLGLSTSQWISFPIFLIGCLILRKSINMKKAAMPGI